MQLHALHKGFLSAQLRGPSVELCVIAFLMKTIRFAMAVGSYYL